MTVMVGNQSLGYTLSHLNASDILMLTDPNFHLEINEIVCLPGLTIILPVSSKP